MAEEMEAQHQRETEIMTYAEWFASEFDSWDKEQTGREFTVGHTPMFFSRLGFLMMISICLVTN